MAKQEMFTDRQTALFCRSLSLQLHAGISLADSVYLLAEDESGKLREVLQNMGKGLDEGAALDLVLEKGGCFPEYVRVMVRIGQQTGRLEQTLESLGDFYEQRSIQKQQIKNALSYPCMVFALMLVVVAVLLIKVLPVFDRVYGLLGSRLTGVAAGLLYLGQLLEAALPALLAVLMLVGILGLLYVRVSAFREKINGWFRVRFGDRWIARKFNNAHFTQALAMGLSSGLQLEEAMELARELLKDIPGATTRFEVCTAALEQGAELPKAMAAAGFLPAAEGRMLTVGLRGGNGDRVMEEIADRLARQAEEALQDTVGKIEPAMVLAASLLVGLILLAVMLPLMNIMSTIG